MPSPRIRTPTPSPRPTRPSAAPPTDVSEARARVARALTITAAVVIVIVVAVVWASQQNSAATDPAEGDGTSATATSAPEASPEPGGPGAPGAQQWDTAAETALAVQPMQRFPDAAAKPQTLASVGLPVMSVPAPTRVNAAGVAEGFPPTPVGAVGQLAALDVAGLSDLDPMTYNAAYRSISLPGAPEPAATPLGAQVARTYTSVVVNGSDSSPIVSRWQLAGALVKGLTNGGRSLTVCVAGELQAAQASTTRAGTGDCQSMRFTDGQWRIAPGPPAAPAPITWPGSPSFVRAGYHPTSGGPS